MIMVEFLSSSNFFVYDHLQYVGWIYQTINSEKKGENIIADLK